MKTYVLTTGTYVVTIAGGGTGRSAANQSGGLAGNSYLIQIILVL